MSLIAISLANIAFEYNIQVTNKLDLRLLYNFLSYKWFFDVIYNKFINYPIFMKAYDILFKLIDKGVVEILGPKGVSETVYQIGLFTKKAQTGFIFTYGCFMLYFLLVFIIIGNFFI